MEYKTEKVRYISHEVKNQLSICDLYTEIIEKYCMKNGIEDETILNAAKSIKRALQLAENSLLELKSSNCQELNNYDLKELLEECYSLSKVYTENKNIDFKIDICSNLTVCVDKNRFLGVIINLVKNACEAFSNEENKYILISTEKEDSVIKVKVSNNAKPIENPDNIFTEGVTTKQTGSGLGLYISKQNIEEMSGALNLIKSNTEETIFEIKLKSIYKT